ncbi:MAG TPA: serine/threonine-protein kinase [Polyangiaceae bacterium]|nr:serine/threonine-protein kinase [Polyangiaceae bacterium]
MSGSSPPKGGDVDPRIGTLLAERYRIDALVGEGGMGRVYSAEHVLMRKRLAVKVLRRELTNVPEVVARFEREAMAAGNIEHPNVAGATDFGKLADGAVFLVLEFVSGRSLRDEIARGPFAVDRALHIARQIASALSAAHAQGIVHRDLKPENVMLVEKGGDPDFVKVLDFGIAKVPLGDAANAGPKQGNPLTKAGMVFGTPEYMSPEQALGQTVDGRADLYALGVMAFEMLSGVRPFSSQSSVGILGQQLSKPTPTFAERAPDVLVPPAVEQIVRKLLARDASERYESAADVSRAIDALLAPIPGHGVYRYTLADGSRPSLNDARISDAALDAPTNPLPARAPVLNEGAPVIATPVPAGPPGLKTNFIGFVRGFERRRRRLPPPVRDVLKPIPTPALLLVGLLLSLSLLAALSVGLLKGVRALRGSPHSDASATGTGSAVSAPANAAAPAATASEDELQDAQKTGLAALEALAAKYPGDARLALELGRTALAEKEYVKAVAAVGSALRLDPTLTGSKQVASVLFQTAQVKASSDATFALLSGPMGTHGPDVAYDLAATEVVKLWVRTRADQALRLPEFAKLSSPELSIALSLRFASTCPQRYALLPRAQEIGDERALGYLNLYRATSGCGRRQREDCYSCLRVDSRLNDAIDAIKQRTHRQ